MHTQQIFNFLGLEGGGGGGGGLVASKKGKMANFYIQKRKFTTRSKSDSTLFHKLSQLLWSKLHCMVITQILQVTTALVEPIQNIINFSLSLLTQKQVS